MSLLFTIIYAAHANGTHHKLALDALQYLPRTDAEQWRRVFLKHADVYLTGSKAPDVEFKDFKNHVLHVRDNFWGGAPEKAANWYAHLLEALKDRDFERAVYAAGVLSHYYTDPIHPFHTAQSDAENSVHRAVEWSINRSYDALRAHGEAQHHDEAPVLPAGANWLQAHVIAGAERSNPDYETLIAHYDLKTGVREPTEGLSPIARDAVSALLIYAAKGFALVLDRAISEAAVEPPEVSLTANSVLATLKVPAKWVTKKIADAETRRQVQAMYDELMATGRVEVSLPEDDRAVRDLHAKEVLAPRAAALDAERALRLAPAATPPARRRTAALKPAANAGAGKQVEVTAQPTPSVPVLKSIQSIAEPEVSNRSILASQPDPSRSLSRLQATPRYYLTEADELERAPSIGPRLAERLELGGIVSVRDFLAADPDTAASLLGGGRYDAGLIEQWKAEARLVLRVPGLRGTHAQLIAGAGYDTADKLAGADPVALSAAVLSFATTPEGGRILRNGDAPDIETITQWVQTAKQALAA